jgi:hypothetical protein
MKKTILFSIIQTKTLMHKNSMMSFVCILHLLESNLCQSTNSMCFHLLVIKILYNE